MRFSFGETCLLKHLHRNEGNACGRIGERTAEPLWQQSRRTKRVAPGASPVTRCWCRMLDGICPLDSKLWSINGQPNPREAHPCTQSITHSTGTIVSENPDGEFDCTCPPCPEYCRKHVESGSETSQSTAARMLWPFG